MDAIKIYKRCDVCWGLGTIEKVISEPNTPLQTETVECPQCHGRKMIYWGIGYEKSFAEVPEEPS